METALRCYAEVNLDQLVQNMRVIAATAPKSEVMAVVKADAYSLGSLEVSRALEESGVRWFGVACPAEAVELRRGGIGGDMLVLGYTSPAEAPLMAQLNVVCTVVGNAHAKALSKAMEGAPHPLRCHLKIDTGMGRIGYASFGPAADSEEGFAGMAAAFSLPGLAVEGAFTHYSVADETDADDIAYTKEQHRRFVQALGRLADAGYPVAVTHSSNSAAIFEHPATQAHLVRPGQVFYGYQPIIAKPIPGIAPALTLKATISLVKTVYPGQDLSYSRTFTATKPMRVATVTAGYADGYPRGLSNQGVCSVNGRPAQVVGRVCMDQLMVDVTNCGEVQAGDEVILLGGGAADSLFAAEEKCGIYFMEIITGLARRVARVYRKNGKPFKTINRLEGENP